MITINPTSSGYYGKLSAPPEFDDASDKAKIHSGVLWLLYNKDLLKLSTMKYTLEDFDKLVCSVYGVDSFGTGNIIGDSSTDVNMATTVFDYLKSCIDGKALYVDEKVRVDCDKSYALQVKSGLSSDMSRLPLMLSEEGIVKSLVKWRLRINK